MLPQVTDTGGVLGLAEAEQHHRRAADDHRHDGGDFDQRQPELQLTEHLDAAQVERADKQNDAEYPDPLGDLREPQPHINAEGGDVRQGDDHHFEGVGPTGEEPGQRAEIVAGVVAERAGNRLVHRHFTQRAHHHEHRRAAHQVGQQHGRAGQLDGAGGAVEQAGADRRAESHETDVPRV